MPETAPETTRKPRTVKPAEYRAEVLDPDGTGKGWMVAVGSDAATAKTFDDTAAAIKWVKANAKEGQKYRVVRVCWSGEIEIVKKEVRKLA